MKPFVLFILCLLLAFPAFAKKGGFSLAETKKFKPKSLKILKKSWSCKLKAGKPKKHHWPEYNQPALQDQTIYVGTHGGIFYAIAAANGKILWKYNNKNSIASPPAFSSGKIYFADLDGQLTCLNQSDGALLWQNQLGREILGKPLLFENSLYILRGEQEVLSLSPDNGQIRWHQFIRTFVKDITMYGHANLVADASGLYAGLADGHLYKIKHSNGGILWEKNLALPLKIFKDIDAAVVLDGNSVYVGGYFGAVYRLRKENGSQVWSQDVATGVPVLVTGDFVVVADPNGALYSLNKETGMQMWFNEMADSVLSEPVLFGNKIFVTSFDQKAFLVDPQNGLPVQKLSVGSGSLNRAIVSGTSLYLLTNDATLMAFKAD